MLREGAGKVRRIRKSYVYVRKGYQPVRLNECERTFLLCRLVRQTKRHKQSDLVVEKVSAD